MSKAMAVVGALIATGAWLMVPHSSPSRQGSLWRELPRDCSMEASALPAGVTRVFIALNGKDGSGLSFADARDGSTAESFDRILRCYSEGCTDVQHPERSVRKTENLTVCLSEGVFHTKGSYDYIINLPHQSQQGFTVGKGWKIHGAGRDWTTLKLDAFVANTQEHNPFRFPLNTGAGLVIGTNSDDASHVEISDLTIDANYPELKSRARATGINALTLEAIRLRSNLGGHWIHDVNVINTAGEIGAMHIRWEAFPVEIVSINGSPALNKDNIIENVIMSRSFGETGCAIAIANVSAQVRHSRVTGYPIGFGGWKMENVSFHDNTAEDTVYGFNVDSLQNAGIRIENNQIIHPRSYGIVIGGQATFSNFSILHNTISINRSRVRGLLLRGNVTGSTVRENIFRAETSSASASRAIESSVSSGAGLNRNNSYQSNEIAAAMSTVFEPHSAKAENCFFHNHDEHGRPRVDMPDTGKDPCVPDLP